MSSRPGLDPLVKPGRERTLRVGVKALRSVLGAAEAVGLDAGALARAHGLAPEELRNPDFRLSYGPALSRGAPQASRERMVAHEMDRVLLERAAALVQPGAMTACERRAVSKALRMERQRSR
ncbi:hypothetical protein ACSRUE_37410 [Sorangium sp. KYC3313]|uniref:hypothetical protein n=1 Tax=Sorangium sp. KYC3313 TaxID=3449740 RepID=UPI003F8B9A0B